jgi:hypothetical protein
MMCNSGIKVPEVLGVREVLGVLRRYPTFFTLGAVLSPGLTSYHFSTRVAPRQRSSDKSPSTVIRADVRAMRIGSPDRPDCASARPARPMMRALMKRA